MEIYFNKYTKKLAALKTLEMQGFSKDVPKGFVNAGWFLVDYDYPEYDKELKNIVPDGDPVWDNSSNKYVQHFNIVYKDLDSIKTTIKEHITSKRWDVETGGITVNGLIIQSGIDDQNRIDSAINGMEAAGMTSTDFKGENGWATLSLDDLKNVRILLANHVEDCFKRERELHEAVDNCVSVEDVLAIDINEGWPSNTGE